MLELQRSHDLADEALKASHQQAITELGNIHQQTKAELDTARQKVTSLEATQGQQATANQQAVENIRQQTEAELGTARQKVTSLETAQALQATTYRQAVRELEASRQQAIAGLGASHQQAIAGLEASIAELETTQRQQVTHHQQVIAGLEASIAELVTTRGQQATATQQAIAELENSHQQAIDGLVEQYQWALNDAENNRQKENKRFRSEIQQLRSQLDEYQQRCAELMESTIEPTPNDIAAAEIAAIFVRVGAKDLDDLASKIDAAGQSDDFTGQTFLGLERVLRYVKLAKELRETTNQGNTLARKSREMLANYENTSREAFRIAEKVDEKCDKRNNALGELEREISRLDISTEGTRARVWNTAERQSTEERKVTRLEVVTAATARQYEAAKERASKLRSRIYGVFNMMMSVSQRASHEAELPRTVLEIEAATDSDGVLAQGVLSLSSAMQLLHESIERSRTAEHARSLTIGQMAENLGPNGSLQSLMTELQTIRACLAEKVRSLNNDLTPLETQLQEARDIDVNLLQLERRLEALEIELCTRRRSASAAQRIAQIEADLAARQKEVEDLEELERAQDLLIDPVPAEVRGDLQTEPAPPALLSRVRSLSAASSQLQDRRFAACGGWLSAKTILPMLLELSTTPSSPDSDENPLLELVFDLTGARFSDHAFLVRPLLQDGNCSMAGVFGHRYVVSDIVRIDEDIHIHCRSYEEESLTFRLPGDVAHRRRLFVRAMRSDVFRDSPEREGQQDRLGAYWPNE